MRIKVYNIFYLLFLAIPVIPLYNRWLTHARVDRYSFNIKTLFFEYLYVFFIIALFFVLKSKYKKNMYSRDINYVILFSFMIALSTFISLILSWDISRSLQLYMFGIMGPFLLFILISFFTDANINTLNYIIQAYISSCIIYLIIAFAFALRGISLTSGIDLLEFRMGGNIYGSNAVIGSISFILPFFFLKGSYWINEESRNKDLYLKIATILALTWIVLSVSRWGYATLVFGYIMTIYLIEKKVNYRAIFGIALIFLIATLLTGNIFQIIIDRYTGGGDLQFDTVLAHSQEEVRFERWRNAIEYIKDNFWVGIGLGNNYMIDVRQSPSAHNVIINFAVERGVLTLTILFGAILSLIGLNYKIQKRSLNTSLKRQAYSITLGVIIFMFWSLTAGSFVQSGGIISAVKAYYFMISFGLLVLISRVDGEAHKKNI